MKVICSGCAAAIGPDDVNVGTDVAFCRACRTVTKLSSLVGTGDSPGKPVGVSVDPANPPAGAWYRDEGAQIVVGAIARSDAGWAIIPFTCVWSGVSMYGLYGRQIMAGKFDLVQSLFGLPFLLGSIFLITVCAMQIAGRVEVRVRGDDGEIFTGVGPIGSRRRFRCSEFTSVTEGPSVYQMNNKHMQAITLEGSRRVRFGTNLSHARRYYMVHALRAVMGVG